MAGFGHRNDVDTSLRSSAVAVLGCWRLPSYSCIAVAADSAMAQSATAGRHSC